MSSLGKIREIPPKLHKHNHIITDHKLFQISASNFQNKQNDSYKDDIYYNVIMNQRQKRKVLFV